MIEQTILNLNHTNPEIRYQAAQQLGELNDPRGVIPLINALPDANSKVQYAALSSLIKIGAPEAAAPIIDSGSQRHHRTGVSNQMRRSFD